ncbi:hypothetical protein CR513_46916, partial [Mucuna pruriens]
MGLCNEVSFCVMCVLGLVIVGDVGYAQNSPDDYLKAHNAARAEVGVTEMAWDDALAAVAQSYANKRKADCQPVHSGDERYGENLVDLPSGDLSGIDAVKYWVDEKAKYDYNSNSCVGGECHHYTQVVWKNSLLLGCAKVTCDNGGTFIVCNYDGPGNFNGEKPY